MAQRPERRRIRVAAADEVEQSQHLVALAAGKRVEHLAGRVVAQQRVVEPHHAGKTHPDRRIGCLAGHAARQHERRPLVLLPVVNRPPVAPNRPVLVILPRVRGVEAEVLGEGRAPRVAPGPRQGIHLEADGEPAAAMGGRALGRGGQHGHGDRQIQLQHIGDDDEQVAVAVPDARHAAFDGAAGVAQPDVEIARQVERGQRQVGPARQESVVHGEAEAHIGRQLRADQHALLVGQPRHFVEPRAGVFACTVGYQFAQAQARAAHQPPVTQTQLQ